MNTDQQTQYRRDCNADTAAALRDLRTLRGLTVEQAADLMGITPARLAIIPTTDPTQPHCQLIETTE